MVMDHIRFMVEYCVVVFFFFFKQKTAYEMQRGLVGSEMCIRDSTHMVQSGTHFPEKHFSEASNKCQWKKIPANTENSEYGEEANLTLYSLQRQFQSKRRFCFPAYFQLSPYQNNVGAALKD
eukprot:TRINITY_DN9170_c0_g1_i1.p2 TRINITY_DN9170_c0_g1~~TRINITY_DN9170_c0_g1_i1.p2  ORF type:complete len:122 (-),score=28.43 TRINITY_DN9170_c0_g1_i1:45-410(-)